MSHTLVLSQQQIIKQIIIICYLLYYLLLRQCQQHDSRKKCMTVNWNLHGATLYCGSLASCCCLPLFLERSFRCLFWAVMVFKDRMVEFEQTARVTLRIFCTWSVNSQQSSGVWTILKKSALFFFLTSMNSVKSRHCWSNIDIHRAAITEHSIESEKWAWQMNCVQPNNHQPQLRQWRRGKGGWRWGWA